MKHETSALMNCVMFSFLTVFLAIINKEEIEKERKENHI